ncbi:MAG: MFS transporter [Candidatus Gastranaerophilales bacterium]|nr:MFS transporter [Candidatus Gastranaerophilales bacterium]
MNKTRELFNKDFTCLFLGQLLAHFADASIQIILISIVMTTVEKPGSMIALLLFSFLLPAFIISPIAGSIVDRYSRKKIMLISSLYRAFILIIGLIFCAFCAIKNIPIQNIPFASVVFVFLIGCGSAFYYPAKMAIVPNIVGIKVLKPANALVSGSGTWALTFGSISASLILLKIGVMNTYYLTALMYVFSALILLPLIIKNDIISDEIKITLIQDIKKTLCFLDKHKKALNMIFLGVLLSLISAIFYSAMNSLATDVYHVGIKSLSRLKGMLGEGTCAGFLIMLLLGKRLKTNKTLVASFLGLFLCLITASFCTTFLKANIWLVGVGIFATLLKVTIDTILQKVSPDFIRGKIFAFSSMLETFATLSGTVIVSILTGIIKPINIFHIVAFLPALCALLVLIFNKEFRYFVLRITIGQIFKFCFKYKFEGTDNIPQDGKVILAGNHTGHLDPLILQMATKRKPWFITGPAAFKVPVIRHLLKWFNVIPLQFGKGVEALDSAVIKLNKGEPVIIFPEGKFTNDGNLEKFHKGVALLAKKTSAPIVPFAIKGGFEAWGKLRKNPKLFSTIVIQFAQPIVDFDRSENEIVADLKQRVLFVKKSLERRAFYKISHKLHSNFLDLMQEKGDTYASVKALSLKTKEGYEELSYIEISRRARRFAYHLIQNNKINPKDRIAIICESRPEFSIGMFGSIQTGAITVPLDVKLTVAEHTHILNDCNPRILLCSSHYLEHALEVQNNVSSIESIYVLDDEEREHTEIQNVSALEANLDNDLGVPRSLDETALIVYTSGTTGNPKGVMISFGNIYSQLRDFENMFKLTSNNTLLSILPLNHLLELDCGFFGMLYMGAKVVYIKSLNPKELTSVMKEKHITNMIVVPLVAKMLKNSIDKQIKKQPEYAQKLFNILYKIAKFAPRNLRRLMFKSVIDGLGGKLECFISGGAPLEDSVAEFFDRIGIPIFQGYGLTETSPTISTNRYKYNKIGTVGQPLPSVKVKLADNGEILVSGPNVMQGYYNKPEMTREVIDEDGWFHTGDIGEIDKHGYIKITGRIKNMIVLGGGKKIFPEEVEAVLENSALIKEVCVMSLIIKSGNKKGTEEVGAIIVPSDDLAKKPLDEIQKELENEVKRLSQQNLAPYKEPTVIAVHLDELPKTSTRKVKRKDLKEWYENLN